MSAPAILDDPNSFRAARLVRATIGKMLLGAFRVTTVGEHNLPATGAILAGNHVSYADPTLLWSVVPRPCHFMAKSELYGKGFLGWALPRLWTFPIRRGQADREAISVATELLKRGELVGIFPEGTRKHDGMGQAQQGAAFIAMRAGVPIVPVGIHGTDRIKPKGQRFVRFPRITIRYGEPVSFTDFDESVGDRKQRMEMFTAEVMRRIIAELAAAELAAAEFAAGGASATDLPPPGQR